MNISSVSITHKSGSSSTRITTLYDLMAEINASSCSAGLGSNLCNLEMSVRDRRSSQVVKEVVRMFESGQIRFLNIREVKRQYAALLF